MNTSVAVDARPLDGPRDLRRAARRGLDAWLAETEDVMTLSADDPRASAAVARLVMREPEAAVPPGSLLCAVRALETSASGRVVPEGFFAGAVRDGEPYVTLWELEELANETLSPPARTAMLPDAAPPVVLERIDASPDAPLTPAPGLLVHSFAGRRGHLRREVLELVPRSASAVLEVGCAEGTLGAALTAGGARVVGIEPDADAARVAAGRLARVVAATLEDALDGEALRDGAALFDTVVMADVLEHLEDPIGALRRLWRLLRPDGRLVLSLPNATHVSVLAGVLQGRWDPAIEGIVADDHLTYAGRAGWTRVLAAGGFAVESWRPLAFVPPRVAPWLSVLGLCGLDRGDLEAVQWLGVARRVPAIGEVELGPSEDDALDPDDPLRAIREALTSTGTASWELPNAVSASTLEVLLRGDVATGAARRALSRAATAHGLARRVRGAGLDADVDPVGAAAEVPLVARTLERARAAGLPVNDEGLSADRLRLTVRRRP